MEDKIMAYGVFMGKRFKPKQKERFINGLGNEFAQMGYTVRLMKDDEKRKNAVTNLIVGDIANATTVYTAYYDTPARYLWGNVKYYPLNGTLSMKTSLWPTYLPIFVVLGLVGAGFAALFMNKELGGDFRTVLLFVAAVLAFIITSAVSRGFANPCNINRNTSGIMTLLDVASKLNEEQRKKVAFLLFDRGTTDGSGMNMVAQAMPKTLDKHQFIFVDCVAKGSCVAVGYRDNNEREARKLMSAYKGNKETKVMLMDEKRAVYTGAYFVPRAVVVTAGEFDGNDVYVSHTGSKKDMTWDEEVMKDISSMLLGYLK